MQVKLKYDDQSLLVDDLRAEKKEALRYLYQKMFLKVKTYICSNHGNEEDAKDIFQETIIALLLKIKNSDFHLKQSNLENYFLGIVKFKWMQELKKSQKTVFQEGIIEARAEEISSADDENSSFISLMWNHFSHLKDDCKNTLQLFFYENKSSREVAQTLGFTEDYVRIKKMRCLQYLRESILKSNEYKHEFNV